MPFVIAKERLLHATLEVNKLREERRKLMDLNNELRAASFRQVISTVGTAFVAALISDVHEAQGGERKSIKRSC